MITQMDTNISTAISSLGVSGKIVTLSGGEITIAFDSTYELTEWADAHSLRSRVSIKGMIATLDYPVVIGLRISRPPLIGFVNAGYTITSAIAGKFDSRNREWHVLGEIMAGDDSDPADRFVTWSCAIDERNESYSFEWGNYYTSRNEALSDLMERSGASLY